MSSDIIVVVIVGGAAVRVLCRVAVVAVVVVAVVVVVVVVARVLCKARLRVAMPPSLARLASRRDHTLTIANSISDANANTYSNELVKQKISHKLRS